MPIPQKAKKVFEGIIFDVYHWEQEMFNGSTATFEALRRKSSVDIIATVDDKVIILQQEQPTKPLFPSLPGGGIEEGEDPLEAAKRELLEEAGYSSDSWEIYSITNGGGAKIEYINYVYMARNCYKTSEQSLDGGEKIEVSIGTFDQFLEIAKKRNSALPKELMFDMFDALLDEKKKEELKKKIFG